MPHRLAGFTRVGANGVAPIRHRVNEYKVEIDPNTLGVNSGNIRITRKSRLPGRRINPTGDSHVSTDEMNIQEELNDLMEDNGVYANLRPAPADLITDFTGRLPDFLLELWKQHGYGSWSNGLYHVCNPHDFNGLLSQVFHADEDFSHKDCHVFGYSAFGGLHVWSEKYGIVDINLTSATLRCINLIDGKKTEDPSLEAVFSLSLHADRKKSLHIYDDNDKPLFARARKRLGDLEPGECYGLFPALAMGGAPRLENLKRTMALEHFLFLAQLQQFTLMDYLSRPIRAVRMIG